MPKIVKIG